MPRSLDFSAVETRTPQRARMRGLGLLCLALAAGCASEPPTRFHSLMAPHSAAASKPALAPLFVDLGPVSVPAAVDQPQWVVRSADDTLHLLERERWVAPLRNELRDALSEGLAQRFEAVDLRTAPAPTRTGWRLRVDVLRFETVAGSGVWLGSIWSAAALAPSGPSLRCQTTLHEAAGADPIALSAAHRRAVARLTDEIGLQLQALNDGRPASCPPGHPG